jgi:predicted enzyme related to lactoylglutathione lyase
MRALGMMHMLIVQDMDRAIQFYENTFEFSVLQKSPCYFFTAIIEKATSTNCV